MKKWLFIGMLFFWYSQSYAQVIYLSTTSVNNDGIYRLDILSCSYELVVNVDRPLTDITFHPDGTLYGISNAGILFEIDTFTGFTTNIFDFNGQIFNSLTTAANGIIYTTGDDGELWSYDKSNNQVTLIGSIGFRPTGDLTFYKGNLYVAVDNDRIVLIDINTPSNSTIAIDDDIFGEIFGIVSYSESCDSINCYAISSGNSVIYQIDFISHALQLVCNLDIRVGGGASTYEFYGSAPVILDSIVTVDPTCSNDDGSITINVTGGIAPFTYSLNGVDFHAQSIFQNLTNGIYTIVISDANGCTISEVVTLENLNGPVIEDIATTPATCGNSNGEINVSVNGGNGTIEYSLDGENFQASPEFRNLSAGIYNITIMDAVGCSNSASVELTATTPTKIEGVTSMPASCIDHTGFLIVDAIGGQSIQYSVDGITFQSGNKFENLMPGTYLITIRDENGCTDTITISIEPAVELILDLIEKTDPTCGANNGSIIITSIGGTGQVTYSINGIDYDHQNQISGLAPATYLITIQDENECVDTGTVVLQPSSTLMIEEIEIVAPRCDVNDGSIRLTSLGGTGQISYSIDGNHFQHLNEFINLGAGVYTIDIKDEEGCTGTTTVTLPEPTSISIESIKIDYAACGENNGSISITSSGGTGQIFYSMDGSSSQVDGIIKNLSAGVHELLIMDENGCLIDTIIQVPQARCEIYIPNTFSPNQDGTNDYFKLYTSQGYNVQINKYLIFDRWGDMVYSANDFPISSAEFWWDGTFRKVSASPGVFAYYIEVEYEDDVKEILKGDVTLIR